MIVGPVIGSTFSGKGPLEYCCPFGPCPDKVGCYVHVKKRAIRTMAIVFLHMTFIAAQISYFVLVLGQMYLKVSLRALHIKEVEKWINFNINSYLLLNNKKLCLL